MYKITFYVPESHAEHLKNAIFATGAGKIGNYSHCCWQVLGEGQFTPLEGSTAFLGKINNIEKVPEYKIELVCSNELIDKAIQALKAAHPYEEPAYQVVKLEDF